MNNETETEGFEDCPACGDLPCSCDTATLIKDINFNSESDASFEEESRRLNTPELKQTTAWVDEVDRLLTLVKTGSTPQEPETGIFGLPTVERWTAIQKLEEACFWLQKDYQELYATRTEQGYDMDEYPEDLG